MQQDTNLSLDETQLTDTFIFTRLWTSPRIVLTLIHELRYEKYFYILMALAGIARAFDRSSMKNAGDKMELTGIIILCVVVGGLFGWITYYLYAAFISWTGKWLNAHGDREEILRILAYAMIPSVIGLLFLIPPIAVYGSEVFKENGDVYSAALLPNLVVYSAYVIQFGLAIYTLVLCVIGVSVVQKLSIGKAILNLLLPLFVIGLPLMLLGVLIGLGS